MSLTRAWTHPDTAVLLMMASGWFATVCPAAAPEALFREGVGAFRAGEYATAGAAFGQASELQPASGTFQNLGLAAWQRGLTGGAILAWERALWLDPLNQEARMDLRFARKNAQLDAPDLAWYEVVSTWLPPNGWAWIACGSFWLTVAVTLLPGILRWRKAGWPQAVAALGLTVFLLSVPAQTGIHTRSRLGFILEKDTPLRLTPTQESQLIARLAAGEPARLVRPQGNYALVRAGRATGWVESGKLGLIRGGRSQ